MEIGDETTLTVILPNGATASSVKSVVWSTEGTASSVSVTPADDSGKSLTATVKALRAGTASVQAIVTTIEDEEIKTTCSVEVFSKSVDGLTLTSNPAVGEDGVITLDTRNQTVTLTASLVAPDATNKEISLISTDPSVLEITREFVRSDDNGLYVVGVENSGDESAATAAFQVKALKEGTASIVAIARDNGMSDVCTVWIRPLVTNLFLDKAKIALGYGEDTTLTATVLPADAANTKVNWHSSNESVAKVDASGKVTAQNTEGTAVITASADQDSTITATCTVEVKRTAVTKVTLDKCSLPLKEGESHDHLVATVQPTGASNSKVKWESLNEDIATVDQTGKVTALKHGTAVITVTTEDNGYTAACAVIVEPIDVADIKISKGGTETTAETLGLGTNDTKTVTLTAAVGPSNATYKTFSWFNSDDTVAEMAKNENGSVTLTAKAPGKTTVIATADDNGKTIAVCVVTVNETKVTAVKLYQGAAASGTELEKLTLTRSGSGEALGIITAKILPEDATYGTGGDLEWFSSDESIVTVPKDSGLTATITTAGPGKAYIVAQSHNGEKRGVCAVTVYDAAQGVSLSRPELTLTTSGTENSSCVLYASVSPATANQAVTWSSSKETVATVDENGTVTAVADGEADITASIANTGFTATCAVTVKTAVESVTLNQSALTLDTAGSTGELKITAFTPSNATDKTITWKSLNEAVATVAAKADDNNTAVVTAAAPGTAAIVAIPADGGKPASCNVTVLPAVAGVYLDKTAVTLGYGEDVTLKATVEPADAAAAAKAVTWSLKEGSDSTIASVDANGKVTAGSKEGSVTVVATASGKTAECTVTVQRTAVTKVTLTGTPSAAPLHVGGTVTLTAALEPSTASNKKLTWTSSDSDVAAIPADVSETQTSITVTAAKVGTAMITVTTEDGGYAASYPVVVQPVKVTGVELSGTGVADHKLSLTKGAETPLTATVKTDGGTATNSTVEWFSTDESVAEVDAGKITAKVPGKTTVIAITSDGGYKDFCDVTVTVAATGVSLDKASATLKIGAKEVLTATVAPSDASDKTVTWTSSDDNVATVANGVVTAKKAGTATVTATPADGGTAATFAVTVQPAVTGLTLNGSTTNLLELPGSATMTLTATVAPDDAGNRKVIWESTDDSVVTVTEVEDDSVDGKVTVTAKKAGTAMIVATTQEGGFAKTYAITVRNEVTGVELSGADSGSAGSYALALQVGGRKTLTATVNPTNATYNADQRVTWQSSDPSKVTVNDGVVIAVAETGETPVTITATSVTNDTKKAECAVTVTAADVSVGGVKIYKNGDATKAEVTSLELAESGTQLLAAEIISAETGKNATNSAVEWSSTYPDVASVTVDASTGVATVTASDDNPGTTTIIVRTADGGKLATCNVTVKPSVTGVKLSWGALTLGLGQTETLTVVVQPSNYNYTAGSVTWESSDPSKVTVSGGTITPVAPGQATITAKVGDVTASCDVTVKATPVKKISLSSTALELPGSDGGKTAELKVTLEPTGASTPKSIEWSSSSASLAAVAKKDGTTDTAVVTANSDGKAGTAIITVTVTDQTDQVYTATCAVTVKSNDVSGLTMSNGTLTLNVHDNQPSGSLRVTVAPTTATDKTLTWRSTNESVATVAGGSGDSASVTAVSAGTAKIIVSSVNGKTAECVVTVEDKQLSGITLDKSALSFTLSGENPVTQQTLVATVLPDGAASTTVTWSSSDESVATVSSGVVTAKKGGTAVITAKATDTDSRSYSATCAVTVRVPVTSVGMTVTGHSFSSQGGRKLLTVDRANATDTTISLGATVEPATAEISGVLWYSSNPAVASVDANGLVTAKLPGTASITVVTKDGGLSDAVTLTVRNAVSGVSISGEGVTGDALAMKVGGQVILTASVQPTDTADQSVTWSSSAPEVAAVENGVVTARSAGVTAITATSVSDGTKTKTVNVTVGAADIRVKGVSLNQTKLELTPGEERQLTPTLTPENPTESGMTWSSSNTNVATVASNGEVTAVAAGAATISVKTTDGGFTAFCTVTVKEATVAVTGVTIDGLDKDAQDNTKKVLTLYVGATQKLDYTVSPSNATNKAVQWTSGDPESVIVDGSGMVVGLKVTSTPVMVTVTTEDGRKTDVCYVTVQTGITSISLDKTALELDVGKTATLQATAMPTGAANMELEWSSSSDDVVSLTKTDNNNYTIKANRYSSEPVTITVAAKDTHSSAKATCTVTLHQPVTGIAMTPSSLEMTAGQTGTESIAVNISPNDANNRNWSYSVVGEAVGVTKNAGGGLEVTANASRPGKSTIFAVSEDGDKTASCVVTVKSALELGKNSTSLVVGATETLTAANVIPANDTLKWYSFNPSVATVNTDSGTITAVKAGTATITAVTSDGTASADCSVTVSEKVVAATGVTLNKDKTTLNVGANEHLRAAIAPTDTTDSVVWSSSNSDVASVDENGVVTAVKAGTATISVKVGSSLEKTCTVEVRQPVTRISLGTDVSGKEIALDKGGTKNLSVTFTPSSASDRTLTWYSSNTDVASVDQNGKVTANSSGTATIVVSAKDGGFTDSCTIKVTTAVTGVFLYQTGSAMTLGKDQTATLVAKVVPEDASNKAVTWSSDNTGVATVDSASGLVTAVAEGTAKITGTTADGSKTVECSVTVKVQKVTHLNLDKALLELNSNKTSDTLTATLEASGDGADKTVTWNISDESIAKIASQTGSGNNVAQIEAVGPGSTIVTASCGAYSASCVVTVGAVNVAGVSLDQTTINAKPTTGNTVKLTATLNPANATNAKLTWYSSNTDVAEVATKSEVIAVNGQYEMDVTFKGEGKASIIVTTADGGHTAICDVDIPISVQGVSVNREAMTLTLSETGNKETLKAIITPGNANDQTVTWSSHDKDSTDNTIVSVDSSGKVTALKEGTAIVTATAGGKSGSCEVTVTKPASSGVTLYYGTVSTDNIVTALPTSGGSFVSGGSTLALNVKVEPSTADQNVTWTSSDDSVATVTGGVITPVKAGTATIFATSSDGRVARCAVTVTSGVTGVAIYDNNDAAKTALSALELTKGVDTAPRLAADVTTSGTVKDVTWSSTNAAVATVDSSGQLSITGSGTATILAIAKDGGEKMASCQLTVCDPVTALTLNGKGNDFAYTLSKTETYALLPTVTGGTNPNTAVTWSILESDGSTPLSGSVVTVSENGLVTPSADSAGTTFYVVATTAGKDSSGQKISAKCKITIPRHLVSSDVAVPKMKVTDGNNNTKMVEFAPGTEGDKVWYSINDAEYLEYSQSFTLSENATVKAYAVSGSNDYFQSAVITGTVTVSGTAKMVFSDSLGNGIETVAETDSRASFTANITLSADMPNSVSDLNMYLAIYDTEGKMIKLTKYEKSIDSSSQICIQEISPSDLNIPDNTKIGSIKLMVLSKDMQVVADSGTIMGDS